MKKYGVATYGTRKKSRNISSQVKFDLAIASTTNSEHSTEMESSQCSQDSSSQRSTTSKKYNKKVSFSPHIKRRKVDSLFNDDLFGFHTEDGNLGTSSRNNNVDVMKSSQESTEDEAYSSAQDPQLLKRSSSSESNSQQSDTKQSPFKNFLKNNVTSLSPKKKRNLERRFSALPTNCVASDTSISQNSNETTTQQPITRLSKPQQTTSPNASATRIRVKREEKQLFTVVRNVKHKHACLEDGETQQFFDDVDFALDGLRKELSTAARCASALDLASQCSVSSFRVNLRAHGIITKIFSALDDAPLNKTLAMCTSLLFYMITRDRLNVDFDQTILGLLLKLLCVSENNETCKLAKKSVHENMIKRIRKILTRLPDNFTSYIDLENVTSVSLARESLLSLTTQRTGEWFKEEMRLLGGLEYLVDIVLMSIKDLNGQELSKNQKCIENIERCLKLIENVTFQNRENQLYLVSFKNSSLVIALARLLKLFNLGIIEDKLSSECVFFKNILDCLKSILRVFLNLTHDNNGESETIGQQDGLISGLLLCVLQVPQYLSIEEQFDILVLALGLLINLVEHSKQNVASLIVLKTPLSYESEKPKSKVEKKKRKRQLVPAIEALVHLFSIREEAARKNENMACEITDGSSGSDELKPTKDGMGWVCGDDIDMTRDKEESEDENERIFEKSKKEVKERTLEDEIEDALQRAGKHMEDSMVASYVALLLGCIAQENKANQSLIRELLPENNFDVLINTLKTFLGFMKLTSGTTGQAIERIIKVLQSC